MLARPCSSWSRSAVFIAVQLSILCAGFITTIEAADVGVCTPAPTVTPCPTAVQAATLLTGGSDLLPVSNAAWTGPTTCSATAPAYSLVTNFGCHYLSSSMPSGAVIITNGNAVVAVDTKNNGNSNTKLTGCPADADITAVSKALYPSPAVYDPVTLTFDVVPQATGNATFQYVFGSEEYPEYAPGGSSYSASSPMNDVFAFFLWPTGTVSTPNRPNIAKVPGTTQAVSIASVNAQACCNTYYLNNNVGSATLQEGLDGITKLLTTSTVYLTAFTSYTFKLAIADVGDQAYDSVVWVKAGSLQFTGPVIIPCSAYWTSATSCTAQCGGGTTSQTYIIVRNASNGGTPCTFANNTVNSTSCNTQPCPVNCVGSWTAWTSCSKACGGGTSTSTFVVTTPAAYGGTNCSFANNTVNSTSCNTQLCPVDCVASWITPTICTKTCGGGTQNSTYIITTAAANGGTTCSFANNTINITSCNTQPCPVNCVGSWTAWSTCSQTCGGGTSTSTFIVTTPAAHGGTNCSAANGTVNSTSCNTQPCPVNCVGGWVNTTTCSKSCGNGTLTQTFVITVPAANGGTSCAAANGTTQSAACNTQACAPVNCAGSWVNTTSCNQSCGGGTLAQTYVITTPAANGGAACGTANGTAQNVACNTQACPVNCVGSWVNTTSCSQSCGGGTLTQTYLITTPAANGGAICGTANGTAQNVACNMQACPVNCVGGWVDTTSCSQSCGGGTLTQTYVITTPAANGGTVCTSANGATQSVACNTQACVPVNCVGSWVNTTSCNQSCGGGTLTQTYAITTSAANGGATCGTANGTTQSVACNMQACQPVNCVADWVNTTSCSQSCGGGTLTQTYAITTPAANGGAICTIANGTTQSVACNMQACVPVNCAGSWVNTTSCNQSCGGGTLTQTYVITTPAANGGAACGTANGTAQNVACNTQACPVNCVGSWVNTTSCSQSCGGGTLTQTYMITTPAANGGASCGTANGTSQSVACNTQACPVNCVGSWVNTTSCSQSCGGGTLTQTYIIMTPAANGGTLCTSANGATQSVACNTQACVPVNCVGSWVNTTSCNQSCGVGTLTQTYAITTPAANGGATCGTANGTTQSVACNTQACQPVNCVADWVNTTSCSQSCGGGTLTQTYVITTPAANGGAICTIANGTTQSVACNTQACVPVNCAGSWVNTTSCNQSCGGGTLTQTYVITTPAANGGAACGTANGTAQNVACNTQACPVNCVGSWVNTTSCSQSCGGGTQTQTYMITTPAANGGASCGTANGTSQSVACNTQACPVNCVGNWVNATSCSQSCGGGTLTQTYVITTQAANGGTSCVVADGTTHSVACNTQPCMPEHCVGSWVNTTACDQPCGGGTLTQTYIITTPAAYNGTDCNTTNGTTQPVACNTEACTPVNCVGSWVNTTACDQPCGGGTLTQTYIITTPAAYNGTNCNTTNGTTQPVACNTEACTPVNCVGSWLNTTACDQPCGGGTLTQTYIITTPAAYNGTDCNTTNGTTQPVACNTEACMPINCVGSWVNTTACDQPCGGGTLTQTYVITTPAAYNGTDCNTINGTTQPVACNTEACTPVNCVGSWVNTTACDQACGGGTLTQTYVITTPAAYNGTDCNTINGTTQPVACNTETCTPVNCVGSWVNTTACDQACGGGTLTQTYVITTPAAYNGTDCNTTNGSTQPVACNTEACTPVNCVGSWVNTIACDQACGGGTLTQTYVITTPAAYNGTDCNTTNGTTQPVACNTEACTPVNCVGSWVNTTACDQPCGGGTLTQTYVITTPAAYNGTDCNTTNGTTQPVACNTEACTPVNCVGSWVNTTACDQACGGGTLTQTYVITTPAAYNGTDCNTTNGTTQPVACNTEACTPVNCVGSWVNTTACDQPCGGGTLTQTYIITTPAAYSGTSCGTADGTTQTAACNTQVCPLLSPVPASASPGSASPSPGSPSPNINSPSPSPSPSPAVLLPSPPSGPAAAPSPTTSPSPGASPSPSPAAQSPSPSPGTTPSPSPHPAASPSPHPSPSTSPSPSPSPEPVADRIINDTVLEQIPYYISPPVLPPLPAMNDSNITIRGGNVTITGVKIEAGGVSVANSDKATPASPATTGTTLPQTNLTLRWAAFNGSLGFYTLGVTITVYGQFVLQRTMNWTWNTQYSAWTTEVAIQGHFLLTRVVETNGQETGTETLNPAVSGLLTLFSSKYPGPGFSGTYDWAGSLDMVPDPFAYWGVHTLGSTINSSRRLMAVPQTVAKDHCCPAIPGRLLLQTDNGNTPVQGRVSVREVNSKKISNTASSQGQTSATDDEISAAGPATVGAPGTGSTTSYSSGPFQAFIAALTDPKNRKFVILAAVLAPTGLAVCVASIIGAVLYRKKRRKEDQLKKQQQKLKDEQDETAETDAAAAAELEAAGVTSATSSAVPARMTRKRRSGTGRSKGAAHLSSSGGGGGGSSAGGSSSLTGAGMISTSHIEFLDPADAGQLASPTAYNLRGRKQRRWSLSGLKPAEGAEEDHMLRMDPVNTLLSVSGAQTPRSPGKHRGRFGSITGSIAGMASSIAGAISHLRHSQTGQAYKTISTEEPTAQKLIDLDNGSTKVYDRDSRLTSPRSTVELPREGQERNSLLLGSAGTELAKQGSLDLNAYPGAQKAAPAVDWGIVGAFKVTPPNSAGKTRLTPPPSAARIASAAAAATATAPRPRQDPAKSVPAQWMLPTLDTYGAQSHNATWATGKASAWAAELKAASRGSTPPPNTGGSGDGDDEVVTGGATFLLPSRARRFDPGGK